MSILVIIVPVIGWLTAQIGGLTLMLETLAFEFILLGRIPGTGLFINFELLIASSVIAVSAWLLVTVFRSPNPYNN